MFESFEYFLQVKGGIQFKYLTSRMSCLLTISKLSNEFEVNTMMDTIHGLRIAQKYLIIMTESFNASMVGERPINFNVMINHKDAGEPNLNLFSNC